MCENSCFNIKVEVHDPERKARPQMWLDLVCATIEASKVNKWEVISEFIRHDKNIPTTDLGAGWVGFDTVDTLI